MLHFMTFNGPINKIKMLIVIFRMLNISTKLLTKVRIEIINSFQDIVVWNACYIIWHAGNVTFYDIFLSTLQIILKIIQLCFLIREFLYHLAVLLTLTMQQSFLWLIKVKKHGEQKCTYDWKTSKTVNFWTRPDGN